jgi:predicted TIM-barrel fold metal-dependent hydrolase
MNPIVDAHQHFWDPTRNYHPWLCDEPMIPFRYGDYSAIRRPYLPADYFADTGRHRVVKTVYVETEWDPRDPLGETAYIHEVARVSGFPNAVVAHARLHEPQAAEVIAAHAAFPLVRSVRHKPKADAHPSLARRGEAGSMDDPRWREGFAQLQVHGLHFDLQTPWWHMDAALELAQDFPRVQIIVNHAGLPADRSAQGLAGCHRAMAALAQAPNVAVKISGLGRGNGIAWTVKDNRPIVRMLIELFGAERCMFASNFPVDSLCATFDTIFTGFEACVQDLPETARRQLFHDNAIRIYRPV